MSPGNNDATRRPQSRFAAGGVQVEEKPTCYADYMGGHHAAERGCDDCGLIVQCSNNSAKTVRVPITMLDDHEALTFHQLPETNGGLKYDQGKPPMSLLDRHAMEEIAKVLAFGAQKYEAHNWRKGIAYSRLLDAALRHLFAFADGEDLDPESGLSHIAHAGCCVVFLLGMIEAKTEMDDRHTA